MRFSYIIYKDETLQILKDKIKRRADFRFREIIRRREFLISIYHPYYHKQDKTEAVRFKGTVDEQDLIS
jgi:hypothetical protein